MAPNKRAKHRSANQDGEKYKNLIISDVLCPICRNILIEPVTLPCNHGFCLACFNGTMENTALTCPLCRIRIGSWLRSARKEKKIINEVLWRIMQLKFSNEIRKKLAGDDFTQQEELPIILATPGEIRKEYEFQLQKERSEIQKERESEAKASELVIKKILEEEQKAAKLEEEKLRLDEEMAKKLAVEEKAKTTNTTHQSTPKSSKISSIDKYLIALSKRKQEQDAVKIKTEPIPSSSKSEINVSPIARPKEVPEPSTSSQPSVRILYQKTKVKQQCSKAYQHLLLTKTKYCDRAESGDSGDSIKQEMRYFKPIRAAPIADARGKSNLALPLLKITPTLPKSPSDVVIRSPETSMLVRIGANPRSAFVSCSPELERPPPLKLKQASIVTDDGKIVKQYYNRNQYTLGSKALLSSQQYQNTSPCLGFQLKDEQFRVAKMRDLISSLSENVNRYSARSSDSKNILKEVPRHNSTHTDQKSNLNKYIEKSPQKISELAPKRVLKYPPKKRTLSPVLINNSKRSPQKIVELTPKKMRKRIEVSPKKLNGCDLKTFEEKPTDMQEKLDLEYAKRLHEELNNPRSRPTRASIQYKKVPVQTRSSPRKRQVTLDELMAPKKFKI